MSTDIDLVLKIIGKKIKEKRKSQGMTQMTLADKSGLTQSHLWGFELSG